MARVLIGDPDPEIRELLQRIVAGMGHAPVDPGDEHAETPDLLLVEPGDPPMLDLAIRLRERNPGIPVVCVSIFPPGPGALALRPAAYLLKPFALAGLQRAIEDAVLAA